MKTLTETCAEVNLNQKLQAVEIIWKDFATTEQYQRVLEHALEMIKEFHCSNWISDMVNGRAVPREAMEWLQRDFIPRAAANGVKKSAFLVTGNAFRKLYSENIRGTITKNGGEMCYFENRVDLENWLA